MWLEPESVSPWLVRSRPLWLEPEPTSLVGARADLFGWSRSRPLWLEPEPTFLVGAEVDLFWLELEATF